MTVAVSLTATQVGEDGAGGPVDGELPGRKLRRRLLKATFAIGSAREERAGRLISVAGVRLRRGRPVPLHPRAPGNGHEDLLVAWTDDFYTGWARSAEAGLPDSDVVMMQADPRTRYLDLAGIGKVVTCLNHDKARYRNDLHPARITDLGFTV